MLSFSMNLSLPNTEHPHKTIHFDILTLFPEMFTGVFEATIIGRACQAGQVCTAGVCTGAATGGDPSVPAASGDPSAPVAGGEPSASATSGDPSSSVTDGDPSSSVTDEDPSHPAAPVSVNSPGSSGCGCSAVGAGKAPLAAVFSALLGLWVFGRRRHRAVARRPS